MKTDVILSFDIGTTNVKCAAVSVADGALVKGEATNPERALLIAQDEAAIPHFLGVTGLLKQRAELFA